MNAFCISFLVCLILQTAKLQLAKQNVIDHPDDITHQEEMHDLKQRWMLLLSRDESKITVSVREQTKAAPGLTLSQHLKIKNKTEKTSLVTCQWHLYQENLNSSIYSIQDVIERINEHLEELKYESEDLMAVWHQYLAPSSGACGNQELMLVRQPVDGRWQNWFHDLKATGTEGRQNLTATAREKYESPCR